MRLIPFHVVLAPLTMLVGSAIGDESSADSSAILAAASIDAWPQFRGPEARGFDDSHPLPTAWDAEDGDGIAWKTPVPGLAHSSPIIWGDRVFVTTAVASNLESELKVGLYGAGDSAEDMVEHSFRVYSLDRSTGAILWEREAARTTPQFARHTKATHVNSTPATDGRHVVAMFGSEGLYCYTTDGELLWTVDTGPLDVGPHDSMDLHWGYASSPIIADGKVIVQADVKESPHLSAYDLATGKEIWRTDRDDLTTWCTPTLLAREEGAHILVNGCKHLGAYRLADGSEVWRLAGGGGIPVPTPVVAADLIYLTSNHRPIEPSHPTSPIFVVRANATGDLGVPGEDDLGEHVAWMQTRHGNYMQTPLIYRGLAYFGKDNGVVRAFDATTGELRGTVRLGSGNMGFSASPVAGDGKLYFTAEPGYVFVLRADEEMETLEMNWMDEICMATPAISRGALVIRTRGHVVSVAPVGDGS